MTQTRLSSQFLVMVAFCASANAGMTTFTYSLTRPNAQAISAAPELADALVYDFFMSTDGDFLLFGFDELNPGEGTFYQDPLGGDIQAPLGALFNAFPALEYDSYLATPSIANAAGSIAAAFPCGSGSTAFLFDENGIGEFCETAVFDTTDDGPQTDFQFARLTVIGDGEIEITGNVQTVDPVIDPEFPFRRAEFTTFDIRGRGENIVGATFVPEPSGWPALFWGACVLILRVRRR